MTHLIKKYLIIAILALVVSRLFTAIILTIWPDILTTQLDDGSKHTLGSGFISECIEFILGIIIVFLLYKDMKRENVMNTPILILTFLSNMLGIILFLLINIYKELIINKTNNMKKLIKAINKYIILLIIYSLFGMPWFYIRYLFFNDLGLDSIINAIPSYMDYLIRLIVVILLIIDFKKYELKNVVISCIAALFFPLLGIVSFGILLLGKEKEKMDEKQA